MSAIKVPADLVSGAGLGSRYTGGGKAKGPLWDLV